MLDRISPFHHPADTKKQMLSGLHNCALKALVQCEFVRKQTKGVSEIL